MTKKKVYALPNWCTPSTPVVFEPEICNGCNICINICMMDVYIPNPEKGDPPVILYPEECWYCGSCIEHCPKPGASKLNQPLMRRVRWKRKDT